MTTFKQKQFAREYIKNNGNGTQAALKVYDTNYDGAKRIATGNLTKVEVQEEINKLLDKAGLGIDSLNEWSHSAVSKNLTEGKPSMQAGISHLQFLYKLHNVLPASKSIAMNYSHKDISTNSNVNDIKKALEELNKTSQALLTTLGS